MDGNREGVPFVMRGVVRSRRTADGATGRLGYAVADQAASSVTNFALGLLMARSLSPANFGAFALVFAAYLVALGVSRSLSSEALIVRGPAMDADARRDSAAASTGSALLVGIVGATVLAVAGLVSSGTLRSALVTMSVVLPGVLLQDAWRFVFLSARAPKRALANDLVWAGLLAPAAGLLVVAGVQSVVPFILAWGIAGTAAGLIGIRQAGFRPGLLAAPRWWRQQSDLAGRYVGEFAATIGAEQVVLYTLAALLGLAAVGTIRTAQLLLGPVGVLVMGIGLGSVPEAIHAAARGPDRLRRVCLGTGVLLVAASAAWTLILIVMPISLGTRIIPGWSAARELFLPVGVGLSAWGLTTGAAIGLRAGADARRGLRARVMQAGLSCVGAAAGAIAGGIAGAAWGLAAAGWVAAAAWWMSFEEHLREARASDPLVRVVHVEPGDVMSGALANP